MEKVREAVILAGGFGTRLRSVVSDRPKPMAAVTGRPFLALLLDYLASNGVERVILSVGYRHESISACFGSSYSSMELSYVVEEKPLGTGGALKRSLMAARTGNILVLNGDSYLRLDASSFAAFHFSKRSRITMAVKKMEDFDRYGSVELEGDKVTSFAEKGFTKSGYINAGVYLLDVDRCGLLDVQEDCFSFERDFLQGRKGEGSVYAFKCNDYFIDIGLPEDYMRAQKELSNLKGGKR